MKEAIDLYNELKTFKNDRKFERYGFSDPRTERPWWKFWKDNRPYQYWMWFEKAKDLRRKAVGVNTDEVVLCSTIIQLGFYYLHPFLNKFRIHFLEDHIDEFINDPERKNKSFADVLRRLPS